MRTTIAAVAALVIGVLAWAPAASAAPAAASAEVYLRIEGATTTIFEGFVTTTPHNVTTAMGGTHACDGLINPAYSTAGPTPTTALSDAAAAGGYTFDGPYLAALNDWSITRIGGDSSNGSQLWGVLVNSVYTPRGGCYTQVQNGDEVLWAYDPYNKRHFLKLTGPATATTNVPFTVTVSDGATGQPVEGATVGDQTTGPDGKASITVATPGTDTLKATKSDSIRSNALAVDVEGVLTATTVASSVNPSSVGQDVAFSATVSPTGGGGTVGFFADGSSTALPGCAAVALAALGGGGFGATCDAGAGLAAGNHPIHAVYSGDSTYLGSSGDLAGGQQVNVTSQTITFPPPASRSIVESPFVLTGVSGGASGNPVTFSASGQCTVVGSTVTLHKTGQCTLTAHQAGNAQYTAAPAVTRTFKITAKPSLRIGDVNTSEGSSGSHSLTFHVTLSKALSVPVTVAWATANGSAKAPDDFTAASGTLTFTPGQTNRTISVVIKGDRIKEPNEVFFVLLTNPHNATIADPNGAGGILNDD